ncbi:hypothetical protein EPI10_024855 [Gossypium australe]|uniref:Uncharacterized protein n=1 Tax=Gossypium australe TaxID=47621 RepID=A0A5B6W091_9ROSI|nr:hypothetical protein EPI10_024855 [Gossypium australe]
MPPKVIIQKPVAFPYKDSKRVPWNYDCNVMISGEENLVSISEEGLEVGFYMRSGKCYDPSNALAVEQQKERRLDLNHLLMSQYLKKRLKNSSSSQNINSCTTRISVLALLLSSEAHRSALMKVLNEIYIADDISINKLERLVNNISSDNFIFFNDDEIPLGGMGLTTLPPAAGVLINNRSALNVLPLSTLNRLSVHSSHMKTCQNIVRAFDGTERKVMGRIEIPLLIGPNTYEVDFLVMDIKLSCNFLLGRHWIHSARVVPSSLHQKLKLVTESRLVTINAEEDIIVSIISDTPYIRVDNEEVECSFRSLEFVNATFIIEWNKIPMPKISKTARMGLQLTVGKGALPGRGLRKYLQGRVEVPILMDKRDRFGLGYKTAARQRKKKREKKQERRKMRLSGEEFK